RDHNPVVDIEGRRLKMSNLDKVLYPEAGFTKGEVIDYYASIAPVLLPHVRDRPLTLKRYPDGVEASSFFEKDVAGHAPDWVRTVRIDTPGRSEEHTSELQSRENLVCRLLLEKKKKLITAHTAARASSLFASRPRPTA